MQVYRSHVSLIMGPKPCVYDSSIVCMILDPNDAFVNVPRSFLILIRVTMMHIPIMHLSMTHDPDICMYDAFINFSRSLTLMHAYMYDS